MHLAHYLGLLHRSESSLADGFREVAQTHGDEPDIFHLCHILAEQCDSHAEQLEPVARRYQEEAPDEPERLHNALFSGTRSGGLGLLRDLHDLYLLATECEISWTIVEQGARGARDEELEQAVGRCLPQTTTQTLWLRTRMKQAAPQALVVAE
jgi:hypothetical protein